MSRDGSEFEAGSIRVVVPGVGGVLVLMTGRTATVRTVVVIMAVVISVQIELHAHVAVELLQKHRAHLDKLPPSQSRSGGRYFKYVEEGVG